MFRRTGAHLCAPAGARCGANFAPENIKIIYCNFLQILKRIIKELFNFLKNLILIIIILICGCGRNFGDCVNFVFHWTIQDFSEGSTVTKFGAANT